MHILLTEETTNTPHHGHKAFCGLSARPALRRVRLSSSGWSYRPCWTLIGVWTSGLWRGGTHKTDVIAVLKHPENKNSILLLYTKQFEVAMKQNRSVYLYVFVHVPAVSWSVHGNIVELDLPAYALLSRLYCSYTTREPLAVHLRLHLNSFIYDTVY